MSGGPGGTTQLEANDVTNLKTAPTEAAASLSDGRYLESGQWAGFPAGPRGFSVESRESK